MSEPNGNSGQNPTLAELRATAESLLLRAVGPDITDTDLFPHGVNLLHVHVKAGEMEVCVRIAGPDHSHSDGEEWLPDDPDDLFEEDDEP